MGALRTKAHLAAPHMEAHPEEAGLKHPGQVPIHPRTVCPACARSVVRAGTRKRTSTDHTGPARRVVAKGGTISDAMLVMPADTTK